MKNLGSAACVFTVVNGYDGHVVSRKVAGGESADLYVDLRAFHGWYDLKVSVDTDPTFRRALAGHVETGRPGRP